MAKANISDSNLTSDCYCNGTKTCNNNNGHNTNNRNNNNNNNINNTLVAVDKVKKVTRFLANRIPLEILDDKSINDQIKLLPTNYNFEIHKTIWHVRKNNAKCIALQFPEGLLMFSCIIADIIEASTQATTIIMGDVTYGACCVDDLTAITLGADMMVHYGHSCLIPIDTTQIKMLYVFVDIQFDLKHFLDTIRHNFKPQSKLAFVGTIQFVSSLQSAHSELSNEYQITIPQIKPLSPGELLGCTSPKLPYKAIDSLVYIADGRFHLESIMISNPDIQAFMYNPYSKSLTREYYDHIKMQQLRKEAIKSASEATNFGVILGTLGRQGSHNILDNIISQLESKHRQYTLIALSEITQEKLNHFEEIDVFIQTSCPRLSIDWGSNFAKPLLTPYEISVALEFIDWQSIYPMDYYANESLGPWTVNYEANKQKGLAKRKIRVEK